MLALLLVLNVFSLGAFPDSTSSHYEYLIRHYTVEDGLPVNSVNGIVQDDYGYLWFSTLDGLVRYDGYDFVTFNSHNSKGIYNNRIAGVMKASTGEIWMLSEYGALTIYKDGTFKTYGREDGVPGQVINIKESDKQPIWIGTSSGMAYLDKASDTFVALPDSLFSTNTWVIEPVTDGVLAINDNGLVRWDQDGAVILLKPEAFSIPYRSTIRITVGSDGKTWVMGDDGFFCLENGDIVEDLSFISEEEDFKVWEVEEIAENRLIFSSTRGFFEVNPLPTTGGADVVTRLPVEMNSTLNRLSPVLTGKEGEIILLGDDEVVIDGRVVLHTTEIRAGFVDREGSIWVSSTTEGLFQIRKSSFVNITPTADFPVQNIYPIIQHSDGSIWAGSFGGGVFRIREGGSGISNWNSSNSALANNLARYLFEDSDGTVYAGLWDEGLWKFQAGNWTRIPALNESFVGTNNTVEAMHRDGSGRLFIGTRGETVVKTGETFNLFRDAGGKGIQGVRVIRENAGGKLLFGTNGSGLGILSSDKILKVITVDDGLSSNFIRDIFLQSEDTVWLATENKGLNRLIFDRNGNMISVEDITTTDGLIDNSLHRIIEDPYRYLWISSNRGIMRIPIAGLNAYADGLSEELSLVGFDERDGMVNREANGGVQSAGILTAGNKLWFPNQRGITIIDPSNGGLKDTLPAPKPVVEQIVLKDNLIKSADNSGIVIPPGERNIRLKFSAPNFAWSKRVIFRYRMEGVDPDWQTGNEAMEATYTNLNPGTYQFEVAAARIGSAPSATSITITVPPFFYETAWFYLLVALLSAFLVYGGHKYRLSALQRRERELQQRVDEQTQKLKEAAEEKSRFFTGITHELKTPLSLILGPLDDLIENRHPDFLEKKTGTYLRMMRRNGRRLKNLVDQILGVSKLNADAIKLKLQPVDIAELMIQIAGQFQSLFDQKGITFDTRKDNIAGPVYVDKDAWERVVINLMSNAVKFSPEGGRIVLTIREAGDRVEVSVRDFGKGIREEDQPRVFDYLYQAKAERAAGGTGIGLYLVKGLIERMGGGISLKSEEGKGAEFTVFLRKGVDHFHAKDEVSHEPFVVERSGAQQSGYFRAKVKQGDPESYQLILIVEDNKDFREYLSSMLSEDYSVHAAANGTEALAALDEIEPALVISDVMMPGMNGLEFVNSLRMMDTYKHLPVIFLSAKDRESDVQTGLSTGADIYLTKPVRSKTLLCQVAAVLRRERVLKQMKQAKKAGPQITDFESGVREIVYRQLANPILNVDMLADAMFMSRAKLYRKWKEISDASLNDTIKKIRLEEGKVLIKEQQFSVKETALAVGFTDPNYFSTCFKQEFGMTPSEVME